MRTLVVGVQRAMTLGNMGRASTWSSVSLSNCVAVITRLFATVEDIDGSPDEAGTMPIWRAIASAVLGWSPLSYASI